METNREIAPEMIEAGAIPLLRFRVDWDDESEVAAEITGYGVGSFRAPTP
jgi:hypothetical protein